MPYEIIQYQDEPIIQVRLYGEPCVSDIPAIFSDTAQRLSESGDPIWRIIDFTGLQAEALQRHHMMEALPILIGKHPGSLLNPRVHVSFVGANHFTMLLRAILAPHVEMAVFATLDEALAMIREQIHSYQYAHHSS